jgi:hypothetical protein
VIRQMLRRYARQSGRTIACMEDAAPVDKPVVTVENKPARPATEEAEIVVAVPVRKTARYSN